MKKSLSILLMAFVLFAGACKKDSTQKEKENAANGSYKLGDKNFNIVYSDVTTAGGGYNVMFADRTPAAVLAAGDGIMNYLIISFKVQPTAGTYQLMGYQESPPTGDKQCQVATSNNKAISYAYVGTGSVNIVVEKVGGKLKVIIPEITVQEHTTKVEVKLSATVTEM